MPRPELSLVIPIYNEEEVLPRLDVRLSELLTKLAIDTEVVFVNDGSQDRSIEILRQMAKKDDRYRVLGFSRNFGHQRAITAGMDKSRGRAVVVMDADLQDPPEVILEMVEKWKAGFDVVYGRRRSREGESWFKLFTAKWFYRFFAALIPIEVPLDTGDFRLMSRRVVRTLSGLRESHRFVRGLVAWVGFKQTAVEYDRAARAAGETKYPLRKMLSFAIDGIASFSIQPLRAATYAGVLTAAATTAYAILAFFTWLFGHTVPGWTTTVVLLSFLFSVQFVMIGVLGEYVGRIYEQVKRRPLYIVSERINFGRRKRVPKIADLHDVHEVGEGDETAQYQVGEGDDTAQYLTPPVAGEPGAAFPPPPAPERISFTPAPPVTGSVKPPPLKLSSSLSSIPAAPAPPKPERASVPPSARRRPSFPSVPHPAIDAMPPSSSRAPSPRTPPAPSVKPAAPKAPSIPRVPSVKSDAAPTTSRSPATPAAPPVLGPKKK